MNAKFAHVPLEDDTVVLLQQENTIGSYEVLIQFWTNSLTRCMSAIFVKSEVAHLTDADLIALVQQECQIKHVSISRVNDRYLFATYGCQPVD